MTDLGIHVGVDTNTGQLCLLDRRRAVELAGKESVGVKGNEAIEAGERYTLQKQSNAKETIHKLLGNNGDSVVVGGQW